MNGKVEKKGGNGDGNVDRNGDNEPTGAEQGR